MTRRFPDRLGAIVLGVVVLLLQPGSALGQADRPEVVELRFQGNASFSERILSAAIVTRATRCRSAILKPFCWSGAEFATDRFFLVPREFRRDAARIQVFYYQRGYREARVDTTVTTVGDEGQVEVTFSIEEGRPVRMDSIAFQGLEGLDPRGRNGLLDDLPLAEGEPLNAILLDAARDSLLGRLRNRGYAHAEVLRGYFVPTERPYEAEVTFDVFPGPRSFVGPVTVVGNDRVSETVVRRMLPFKEGDVYAQEVLFDGQRNLFNLEIFRHATIEQDLDHRPDSVVPIRVQVNEGNVHLVRTGVGWSTSDCLNTEVRWSSRNFVGGARRLQLRGRVSNILAERLSSSACGQSGTGVYGQENWLLSADFAQPWFFSPRNSLAAGIFAERQSLPEVFVRKGLGANIAVARSLGRGTSLTLAFRPQLAELDAAEIFLCTSFLVCEPRDIDVLEGPSWLSPVALSLTRDRTNRAISPTDGHTALVDVELARDGTFSDYRYERVIAEGTWFQEPWRGVVLAARLRAGWLNARSFGGLTTDADVAHPQKRFFAGGANSVRGFGQNQLGPRVLTVGVPEILSARDGEPAPCTPEEIRDLTCDAGALGDGEFDNPRPTGGSRMLDGTVEIRFQTGASKLTGAAFLDFGQVWASEISDRLGSLEFTPGLGVRYATPIGPLRVDLAYRFSAARELRVITSQIQPYDPARHDPEDRIRTTRPDGSTVTLDYVRSDELAPLEPRVLFGEAATFDISRFQLHVSIGQAF